MQPEQRRKSYTIWSDSGGVQLMRRSKRRTYGAIHLNSPSYLRCNLLLFRPISPCVFPFPQHPYIPSPHVKWYETQNILLNPLQSERGNVILRAKRTHTPMLFGSGAHTWQRGTIYVCWSEKWLTPNFRERMKCKGSIRTRAFTLKGKMKSLNAIRSKFAQLVPFSLYAPQVYTGVRRLAHGICSSNSTQLITDM